MSRGTSNPRPSRTMLAIFAVVAFFVAAFGYFALAYNGPRLLHLSALGGLLPAGFVIIAVAVGAVCVGIFVHRHPHKK